MYIHALEPAADFLQAEHRRIDEGFSLFFLERSIARSGDMLKGTLRDLKVHLELEEELFYPEHFSENLEEVSYHEALVVHEVFKKLIVDIEQSDPADLQYQAMVRVLWKLVARHFVEEEGPKGIFIAPRWGDLDLAERLESRRDELLDLMSAPLLKGRTEILL